MSLLPIISDDEASPEAPPAPPPNAGAVAGIFVTVGVKAGKVWSAVAPRVSVLSGAT